MITSFFGLWCMMTCTIYETRRPVTPTLVKPFLNPKQKKSDSIKTKQQETQ